MNYVKINREPTIKLMSLLYVFASCFVFFTGCSKDESLTTTTDESSLAATQSKNSITTSSTDVLKPIYYFPLTNNLVDSVSGIDHANTVYTPNGKFTYGITGQPLTAMYFTKGGFNYDIGMANSINNVGTLSFWMYADTIKDSPLFHAQQYWYGVVYSIRLQNDGSIKAFSSRCFVDSIATPGEFNVITGPVIKTKRWYHIIIRWDDNYYAPGQGLVHLFVNNTLLGIDKYKFKPSIWEGLEDNEYAIGLQKNWRGNHDFDYQFFNGRLDEIKFYRKFVKKEDFSRL
ncbi:hypothetical protein GS399_07040 [Pedobacter sp. HMF7647]|uniref:LamG domain-containing protein n=1 Tax=Hufsiella arboris TaxID=2695275 RepID=A0A7K1Y812_9SPHI|nr:LamG domain-containing protein [Hufsiella arboris]MXV50725.1 hypothetical protein [Hufsiella arboris]